MAKNDGTLIGWAIRPNDSLDKIATAYAKEIKGGLHTVDDINERDNIMSVRREWGMLCYVTDQNETYQLIHGHVDIDIENNLNWAIFDGSGSIEIGTGDGLTMSGGTISIDTTIFGGGLTYSGGVLSVVNEVPIWEEFTPSVTNGDNSSTDINLINVPSEYSRIDIYVNGKKETLGNGDKNRAFYFSNDSGSTALQWEDITTSSVLYWNGGIVGYELDQDDDIEIVYEGKA